MGELVHVNFNRPLRAKMFDFVPALPSYGPKKEINLQDAYENGCDLLECYLSVAEELQEIEARQKALIMKMHQINARAVDILESYE